MNLNLLKSFGLFLFLLFTLQGCAILNYPQDYTLTICADQNSPVRYISSIDSLKITNENNASVAVLNDSIEVGNHYILPDSLIDSGEGFYFDNFSVITWQEIGEDPLALTLSCFVASHECFSLSAGEIVSSGFIQLDSSRGSLPEEMGLEVQFTNTLGQVRNLSGTMHFATHPVALQMTDVSCFLHCEDACEVYCPVEDPFCILSDSTSCTGDRFCSFQCADGAMGSFTYFPGLIWLEEDDLLALYDHLSPECALENTPDALPNLSIPVEAVGP